MKNIIIILLIFLSTSCQKKSKDPITFLEGFTRDCFISKKPLDQVLLDYTILNEKDLSKDTKILFEYCEFINQSINQTLEKNNNQFNILLYDSNSMNKQINLNNNEKAFVLYSNEKPVTVYVLDTNDQILSYYIDPFETKGNSKPSKPAYLKDILELKKEN